MDIFVLLETGSSFALSALCAALALSAGFLVFDRAPGTDARTEDAAQPEQRRAA